MHIISMYKSVFCIFPNPLHLSMYIISMLQPLYLNFFKFYDPKKQATKSHKTFSSTRFSPTLSPLPIPQHLDVQPPTYHPFYDFLMPGDKIFHCILREEFLELTVKLSRQCLIVRVPFALKSPPVVIVRVCSNISSKKSIQMSTIQMLCFAFSFSCRTGFLLSSHRHMLKPDRHRTIIPVILIPVCGEHHIFLEF